MCSARVLISRASPFSFTYILYRFKCELILIITCVHYISHRSCHPSQNSFFIGAGSFRNIRSMIPSIPGSFNLSFVRPEGATSLNQWELRCSLALNSNNLQPVRMSTISRSRFTPSRVGSSTGHFLHWRNVLPWSSPSAPTTGTSHHQISVCHKSCTAADPPNRGGWPCVRSSFDCPVYRR